MMLQFVLSEDASYSLFSHNHMYPYIHRLFFLSLCCKRATNYDASLVFQDVVVKSTFFAFLPSFRDPRCPPARQSHSRFRFWGEGRERIGMSE
jgi:hypothetical protein